MLFWHESRKKHFMTILKSENQIEFFSPFGPVIGHFKMPNELTKNLNNQMDERLEDFSKKLVGKVKQELRFDNKIMQIAYEGLGDFLIRYKRHAMKKNLLDSYQENLNAKYNIEIMNAWFVRQFEHEYNPLHIHIGCELSCVGYLALPENIEYEWKKDYEDHHPANGHIQFSYGEGSNIYCLSDVRIKPQIGDFYVFPSTLKHCVYPFYSKGERRSFSMNLNCKELS